MNNPVQQQQANPQQERPCEKRVIYRCEKLPSSVLKKPEEQHSGEGMDSIRRRLAS